jgi:8-oxo-dGTP pyrophosphatase MutT (NUDIX family)
MIDSEPQTDSRIQVAIAILWQDDTPSSGSASRRFLMQLRDDNPTIRYPGVWAFFGGHLDPGEAPEQAMWRELREEIAYQPPLIQHFRSYVSEAQVIRHVFAVPLIVPVIDLELNEGIDLRLLTIEEVRRGSCYSDRIGQVRALAQPHQQILLDFLREGLPIADAPEN